MGMNVKLQRHILALNAAVEAARIGVFRLAQA
jgi:predicted transcriptional regulator